jgi:hypothetical protein
MQLAAISGQTVMVNCAGATVQSGVVPPCNAGITAAGAEPLTPEFAAPVGEFPIPPPQAPSIAARAKVASNFPITGKRETTSDGIGVPMSVQSLVGGTNTAGVAQDCNSAVGMSVAWPIAIAPHS